MYSEITLLTHWGRVTHICVGNLTIIGSDNGLSPSRHQAIIWTNAGILLIRSIGTNFNEILIEIHIFSFTEIHLKMSSGKWRPSCLFLNVLKSLPHLPGSMSYCPPLLTSGLWVPVGPTRGRWRRFWYWHDGYAPWRDWWVDMLHFSKHCRNSFWYDRVSPNIHKRQSLDCLLGVAWNVPCEFKI